MAHNKIICCLKTSYGFSSKEKEGNDQYEGFCIDIIMELAAIYKFKYVFINQKDKNYGEIDKVTGEWK